MLGVPAEAVFPVGVVAFTVEKVDPLALTLPQQIELTVHSFKPICAYYKLINNSWEDMTCGGVCGFLEGAEVGPFDPETNSTTITLFFKANGQYDDSTDLGTIVDPGTPAFVVLAGDFNFDGQLNATDIDLPFAVIRDQNAEEKFDLNQDNELNQQDVDVLVGEMLRSQYGDVDLRRRVDFSVFLVCSTNFGKENVG